MTEPSPSRRDSPDDPAPEQLAEQSATVRPPVSEPSPRACPYDPPPEPLAEQSAAVRPPVTEPFRRDSPDDPAPGQLAEQSAIAGSPVAESPPFQRDSPAAPPEQSATAGPPPPEPFPFPRDCPYDPPPRLAQLQRDAPISRVRIWDGSTPWLLTRYDDVRAVLADRRFSVDPTRPGYPARGSAGRARRRGAGSFISMDAPEHTRLRRMLITEFTPRRIAALRPAVERTAAGLIDKLGPGPVDLVRAYALPLASIVIAELLGVPYDDHEFFEDRARVMVDNSVSGEENRAATADLARYLAGLIERRRAHPADDLLGRLSAQQVGPGRLDRAGAVSMAVLLLVAGHETTANQIALSVAFLLRNPRHANIFRQPDGPPATAVDELLRLLTITHTGRRRVATADVPIGGVTIRAGDGVIAAADIANRDPDRFPGDADLARTPNHHLAFGHGEHLCLGLHLARLELDVALAALFRRLPALRLAVPEEELPFRHEHPIYGIDHLPVEWS